MVARDVNYEHRIVGSMPTKEGSQRGSQLEEGIKFVTTNVDAGQAVIIADYATRVAAAAAVNGLKHRYGPQEASGLNFDYAKNGTTGRTELFVVYDGSLITDEGKAAQVVAFDAWREKQRAKTREYQAKKKSKEAAAATAAPKASNPTAKPVAPASK